MAVDFLTLRSAVANTIAAQSITVSSIITSGNVGIGSTTPLYANDVVGTIQVNGAVPAFGQPDANSLPPSAYASFGQSWNAITPKLGQVAVSATGQYQTTCTYGTNTSIYYSNNYGSTWNAASGSPVVTTSSTVAMSGNGQYQLVALNATTNTALYLSSNYGQSWAATTYFEGFNKNGGKSYLSYNGQYQFHISTGLPSRLAISSNYGASFTIASIPINSYTSICCSSNGQYVSVGNNSSSDIIYYSTDYGVTWASSTFNNTYTSMVIRFISSSPSGQFQIAIGGSSGPSAITFNSNDYGATWTQISSISENPQTAACTSSCQYIIMGTYGSYLYYSKNYGSSWTQSSLPTDYWYSSAMSQNGQYALMSATGSYTLQLVNYGLITNGRIGIGTTLPGYALHVGGAIYATGNISAFSDQRYKQNIVRMDHSLDAIRSLSGYYYTRDDYLPGERHIGLLAQEVKEVLPEAVSYDSPNDKYSVNYNCLIAPVVEAIKELYDRSEAQAKIIEAQAKIIEAQQVIIQKVTERLDLK